MEVDSDEDLQGDMYFRGDEDRVGSAGTECQARGSAEHILYWVADHRLVDSSGGCKVADGEGNR